MLDAARRSAAVLAAVDKPAATLAGLEPHLTARVLQHLMTIVENYHRAGPVRSPDLDASRRAAAVAVQIDPRWS